MRQFLFTIIVLFSSFSFSQEDENSENATIYIARESRKIGGVLMALHPYTLAAKASSSNPNTFTNYFIADNSNIIGKISRGNYLKYDCAPGEHVFSAFIPPVNSQKARKARKSIGSKKIYLKAGNTYYLKTNVDKGIHLIDVSFDSKELIEFKEKIEKKEPVEVDYAELEEPQIKYKQILTARVNSLNPGNFDKANSLLAINSYAVQSQTSVASSVDYSNMTLEELKAAKTKAVSEENYTLASILKDYISTKKITVSDLEVEKQKAIAEEDYEKAEILKRKIGLRKKAEEDKNDPSLVSISGGTNKRDKALTDLIANKPKNHSIKHDKNTISSNAFSITKRGVKKDASDSTNTAVYRRSSLYTLMINNPVHQHTNTIKNTFGNIDVPEKFNDHNVGPYIISTPNEAKDKTYIINDFLSTNNIAKELVSKWFNRSEKGGFNMDLISERGSYNATDLDVSIALNNERGFALLTDAGEELIKNTFVVVNDYKYTDKEEIAEKAGKALGFLSTAASFVPGGSNVSNIATAVQVGTSIAGKGYVIKSTTYLYKLVWNEEVAATFYNDYWTTDNEFEANKKEAFDKSDAFRLELVGTESAWADLQSSVFTKKSDTDLISVATVKSTNKSIAKLQRKYEVFRTKSPLLSGDPLSAKIGLKEGIEKGDKYEVLEQIINKEGLTEYKRIGVIKVDKAHIWDNRFMADEEESNSEFEYTTFTGSKNKYFSGMLIRQLN
ncbi:hypothetical protein GCM10023314_08880 [Algibacter agarivorans]|uniref:DUF2846 domain-containing protein n=1 Tax=Algibacter agarivorans TaxID=1109741 RepID=A0ABP9GDC8_9FLAO